jgi:hypothetical protein
VSVCRSDSLGCSLSAPLSLQLPQAQHGQVDLLPQVRGSCHCWFAGVLLLLAMAAVTASRWWTSGTGHPDSGRPAPPGRRHHCRQRSQSMTPRW